MESGGGGTCLSGCLKCAGLQSLCTLQELSLQNNGCADLGQLRHLSALTKLNAGHNRLCVMPTMPLLHLQHLILACNRSVFLSEPSL